MITVTYAFGNYTGILIVKDWTIALRCIAAWSNIDEMNWIRIQLSPVAE